MMLLGESIVFLLLDDEVLFLLLELLLQEVDQVIVATLGYVIEAGSSNSVEVIRLANPVTLCSNSTSHEAFVLALSLAQFLHFLLQPLDHFLAEVRALGKLLLDLLVDFDLPLVSLNLSLHLVVLEDEDLSLLGLVLQLCRQLMILQDGQVCRCLQLLVIHGEQIGFGLFDVKKHLLA